MAHVHNEPGQHDMTASAHIIFEDGTEPRLWLHMHKKLGRWLQFGGHIELDENPWQAVVREVAEESGYQLHQLRLLQPRVRLDRLQHAGTTNLHPLPVIDNTHLFSASELPHFHTDRCYVFITSEQPGRLPGKGESETMKAMTATEISTLPVEEISEHTKEIAMFILDQVLPSYEQVDPLNYKV